MANKHLLFHFTGFGDESDSFLTSATITSA